MKTHSLPGYPGLQKPVWVPYRIGVSAGQRIRLGLGAGVGFRLQIGTEAFHWPLAVQSKVLLPSKVNPSLHEKKQIELIGESLWHSPFLAPKIGTGNWGHVVKGKHVGSGELHCPLVSQMTCCEP